MVLDARDWEEITRIKTKIKTMLQEDSMGYIVRSRYDQNTKDEIASLYHASKEYKNRKNDILKLKVGNQTVTDRKVIEREVVNFFGALFNGHHDSSLVDTGSPFVADDSDLNNFLQDLASLAPETSANLEEDVDIEELDFIIKECSNNKSPGLDGLSYEFYKKTWPIIRKTFTMIIQCQLDRQRIVGSNCIGATRLLPKVVGVPKVDELRPITLLNCDYRILTKLLVKRMRPCLPEVIKSGQLCTVGDRKICFGVQNILSSVLYINQRKNIGACLISLDFFKAYDRVLVTFLLKVMKKMGFGPLFCGWIAMLHENAQTKFLLQEITGAIEICFSIRQGDPIAMILYILYIEPLLVFIEKRITGLRIQNIEQKVEAYCDDVNIMTTNVDDLRIVDSAVTSFEQISGAILSRNFKCKVLGLGLWKNKMIWPLDYLHTVKEIKVFGFYIMNSYRSLLKGIGTSDWKNSIRLFFHGAPGGCHQLVIRLN